MDIARDILAYLAEHPQAQDTLEGVTEWWLLERRIKREAATVKEALAALVAQGLVIEKRSRDAHIRYQVNQARLREIRELVKREAE